MDIVWKAPVRGLRNRSWVLLALACAILATEIIWFQRRQSFQWLVSNDFIEYWSAGQLLREGRDPYDLEALYVIQKGVGWSKERPLAMWNPPWLLVLLYPLLTLPFGTAVAVWLALSSTILLGCTLLIWAFLIRGTSPMRLLVPLLATVTFTPVLFTLRMGQVSVLILLGIAGFLHFERQRRDFWAGVFLMLLTLKPHVTYLLWIAIAWWIIAQRRGKVLWGLGSALLVLCVILTPLRPTWALDYVYAMQHPPLYWRAPVMGTMLRIALGWDRTWLQYVPALIVGPLVLIALCGQRFALVWRDIASPLLLLSVPTAAYGWSFDQLVLLLPYLQVVGWLRERHHGNHIFSLVVAIGLLTTSALLFLINWRIKDDLYLIWGPLSWGLLYAIARWAPRPQRLEAVSADDGERRS